MQPITIALDAMGGDHGPSVVVPAALAAVERIDRLRAVDGGGLENARYVEDFTALLLNINRIYKAHSSLRIVGV